jgi:hypothetical protein
MPGNITLPERPYRNETRIMMQKDVMEMNKTFVGFLIILIQGNYD